MTSNQPLTPRRWRDWPLLTALGLQIGWTAFIFYGIGFPDRDNQTMMFYPWIKLKATHFLELVIGLTVIVIGLVLVFMWREGLKRTLNSVLCGVVVLGINWSFGLGLTSFGSLPELDTLSMNGTLYRLTTFGGGLDDYITYKVIACDVSGHWCRYYSTPALKQDNDEEAHLIVDSDSGRLMLYVGSDIYDVEAHDILELCDAVRTQKDTLGSGAIADPNNECPWL